MNKYLDSGWLALYVTIAFGILQVIQFISRRRKALRFEVSSLGHVVSVEKGVADSVEVYFKGQKVRDVSVIWIAFRNTGNTPIRQPEIYTPLGMRFLGVDQILQARIERTTPPSLKSEMELRVSGDAVEIAPCLLNPGDTISMAVVLSGYSSYSVLGRVEGISEIKEGGLNIHRPGWGDLWINAGLMAAGFLVASLVYPRLDADVQKLVLMLLSIVVALSAITLGVFLSRMRKRRRPFN